MEFKGTKVLQADLKHKQVLNGSGVLVIANINDYSGEGKYNTLLYSKAPEMLEMLKSFVNDFDSGLIEDFSIPRDRFEKLIEEATEL